MFKQHQLLFHHMKKKLYDFSAKSKWNVIFVILIAFSIVGCTADADNYLEEYNAVDNNLCDTEEYNNFILSVDSVNQKYAYLGNETRGSFGSGAGTAMADYMGYACGGSIGRWVGGSLGSLSGNPIAVYAGILIGGRIGPSVCGSLASGLASLFTAQRVIDLSSNYKVETCFAFSDIVPQSEDSIGYHHNKCMAHIHKNRNNYILDNSSVDREKVYADIVKYYKSIGIYDSSLDDSYFKSVILHEMVTITDISEKFQSGQLSESQLVDRSLNYMERKLQYNESEVDMFRNYYSKIIINCSKLNVAQVNIYAEELHDAIDNSGLSNSIKSQIAASTQFIINSSLCWLQ